MGIQINGQTDTVTATDGSINVGGDVTIPGVLTYEDVTNIDSIGIGTFRNGIDVTSGTSTFAGRVNVGANNLNDRALNAINASTTVGAVSANNHNANGILFQGYNTSVDANNASFVVRSNGSTGIGTAVPSQLLHLHSDSSHKILLKRGGQYPSECIFANEGNLLKISNNVNGIHFDVGSSSLATAMYIEDGGNIGIGTDNPSNTLSVIGSDTPPVYIAGANPGIKFEDTNASGTPISYIYASDGQLSLRADDGNESGSSLIEFKVDGSEKARITSNGDLMTGGITSGAGKVQVGGGLRIAGSATHTDTPSPYLYRTSGVDNLCISTSALERVRITSDGKLIHGVSSSAYDLTTAGNGYRGLLIGSTNGATAALLLDGAANGDGTGSDYGSIEHNSNGEMRYKNRQNSGSGGAGHVFYTTNSDTERLRIEAGGIVDITGKLRIDISSTGTAGSGAAEGIFLRNTNQTDNNAVTIFGGADDYNAAASAINFINVDHSANAGDISFDTRSTSNSYAERLRITSAGIVKINNPGMAGGTSAANALLQIKATGQYDGLVFGNTYSQGAIGTNSQGALIYTGNAAPANLGGGLKHTHIWYSGSSGGGAPSEKMSLATDGTLYLGPYDAPGSYTSVPRNIPYKIKVAPYGWQHHSEIACISMGSHHGTGQDDGQIIFQTATNVHSDTTGLVSRVRITEQGSLQNFCTNTTNIDTSNSANAGNSHEFIYCRHSSSALTNGTNAFRVTTNGNVTNTNNSYGSLSDRRLKENIVNAGSQWDDIKSIQIRKFNFRENTGHPTHTQLGLIAQEIESVSPGLVENNPVKDDETVLDANGNQLESTKSINYSVLYMKAVKALQESMARIETLEAKVAALESA